MDTLMTIFNEVLYLGAASSILIVLILLVKKVFGKVLSAKWHYYIWMLLLVRLIVPFSPESSLSALNLFYSAAEQLSLPVSELSALGLMDKSEDVNSADTASPENNSVHIDTNHSGSTVSDTADAVNAVDSANAVGLTNSAFSNSTDVTDNKSQSATIPFIRIAAFLWVSGILLLTGYTVFINIMFAYRVRRYYKLLNNPRILGILKECKRIARIKRNILLYTTKRTRTPSLYSSFHVKILVSEAQLEQLSDQEIKYIFLHELSHYKRKDITVNWIITLLQIIYFFHPLIWLAFYKMHEDCEISCDAQALKYLKEEEYQGYGSTVIKLIKLFSESSFIPATAGLWKHKSNYRRRIIMISKFKKSKWTSTFLTIIIILVVGITGLTGCRKTSINTGSNATEDTSSDTVNTGSNQETDITAAPTPTITEAPTNIGTSDLSNLVQLADLLGLSKEELISKLGEDYSAVDEGGLEFSAWGIRVWFDAKSITNQIFTDKPDIDFNGAKIGDSIDRFTEVLGDAVKDDNGEAVFKADNYYVAVYYDENSDKTFAVYVLSEDAAAAILGNESTAAEPAQDETGAAAPTQAPADSQVAEGFYGNWVIDQVLAYGSAGTYSKESSESLIGKSMSFSADGATCFGDQPSYIDTIAKKPVYTSTDLASSDFVSNYRMTFEKLGITAASATQVTASDSEGNGCTFLIKDDNTLIVIGGGTYFELVRKPD